VVLPDGAGVKGARMDSATASIGSEQFRKGCVKVIRNEWGNDILVAVWNDKEVTRTNGIEIVLPTRAREHTRLRTCGTRGTSLCISVHCFGLQHFGFGLLV